MGSYTFGFRDYSLVIKMLSLLVSFLLFAPNVKEVSSEATNIKAGSKKSLVQRMTNRDKSSVELPNVKFVDCMETVLDGFDSCLSVKFSYLEEYAGLKEQGSPQVLVGKLYSKDGTEN